MAATATQRLHNALLLVHVQIMEPLSKQWPPTSPPPAFTPKSASWRNRFHCNTLRYILQCRLYILECIARSCAQARTPHPTQPPHRPSIAAGRSPGALAQFANLHPASRSPPIVQNGAMQYPSCPTAYIIIIHDTHTHSHTHTLHTHTITHSTLTQSHNVFISQALLLLFGVHAPVFI